MERLTFSDFEACARAVLAFLHRRLGFGLWMVTRTEGDDWIVLQSEDHGYGVEPGMVFRWADSFCSHMVKGNGPRIAPSSAQVPEYAAAPIGQAVPIQAYVGVPLRHADGSLFGTLCAIDPQPQPAAIVEELPLVELLASLLSTTLQMELRVAAEARRAERFEAEALTDAMTRLYNRGAWEQLLAAEEERCRRYGDSVVVVMVDLDELKQVNDSRGHAAGDALIVRSAAALRRAVRESDIVARLGGDEFGVIGVGCGRAGGEALSRRIEAELAAAGIRASLGFALRDAAEGIKGAWAQADRLMYQHKHARDEAPA